MVLFVKCKSDANRWTLKYYAEDFPVGSVIESLPAHVEGHRFDPWSEKIPHATGEPSLCTTTPEAPQEKSLQWEAYTLQLETNPCSLQVEKACTQQQRPSTDKNKLNKCKAELKLVTMLLNQT